MEARFNGSRHAQRRPARAATSRFNGFEMLMFSLLVVGLVDCVVLGWLVVHSVNW